MEERRKLLRHLLGSSRAMRAQWKYLPREPGEVPTTVEGIGRIDPYRVRQQRTVLWPFFSDGVGKLVGKVFSEEITLGEDMPDELRTFSEDVDKRGHNLTQFAYPLFFNMWVEGMPFVLVDRRRIDAPVMPSGVSRLIDDDPAGSFWIYYPSVSVLRAVYGYDNGRLVWQRIQLSDPVEEADGEWGTRERERIRVLYRGDPEAEGAARFARFEFYRETEEHEWVLSNVAGEEPGTLAPHTEIPGRFFRFGRDITPEGEMLGPDEIWPELENLGDLCLAQYQKRSDQDGLIHRIKNAMILYAGVDADKFADEHHFIGPFHFFLNINPESHMDVVETSGAGAEIGAKDLEAIEAAIRVASLRPELPDLSRAPSPATNRVIDTKETEARLKASALLLKDGLEELYMITAKQMKLSAGGSIVVPLDYALTEPSAPEIDAIFKAREAGLITRETTLGALKKIVEALEELDVKAEASAVAAEADLDKMKSLQASLIARN